MPNGEEPPFAASRRAGWLAIACLVGAILTAYHNSFSGPFVFDDTAAIVGNPTIRHLADLGVVLSPPQEGGQTVGGRPVVNLSLAVNYAIGGTNVRGYHVFNLIVHTLGALVLFGVARRTLLQPALREKFGSAATALALAIAVLWAVHPLLTESVTYVIQRAESLMGLFYLLTLYCFVRGVSGERRVIWLTLSFLACLVGMATKEVMVSAPLIVLLYDRTLVAGSWRAAWAQRKMFYVSLGATWVLLGWLVLGADHRGGTAGLGMGDSVWTYALTQTRSVALYLRLALWPRALVFDYGTDAITSLVDALPFVFVVVLLIAGAAIAWWRWPAAGFLGVWFFAILAPSSSIVPIPVQPTAEHRMYLPLAAVVTLAVLGLYARWRRGCWVVFAASAVALASVTVARNVDYREATSIWADTVAKRPTNARAHCYLADALAAEGKLEDALTHYDEALRHDRPAWARGDRSIFGDIMVNSGNVLRALGRDAEAVARYEEALRIDPKSTAAHFNLGALHLQADRLPAAVSQFEATLKIDPNYTEAHTSLGSALLLEGKQPEALLHYEAALRLDPSAKAHQNLGIALIAARRLPEAAVQLERAATLAPDVARTQEFLGHALSALGRRTEAIEHYRRAMELEPGNERVRSAIEAMARAPR